jgi:hypothetical protein
MKTGDLDSLYEIYGDRGSLLRKSVEKALADPKPATAKTGRYRWPVTQRCNNYC